MLTSMMECVGARESAELSAAQIHTHTQAHGGNRLQVKYLIRVCIIHI